MAVGRPGVLTGCGEAISAPCYRTPSTMSATTWQLATGIQRGGAGDAAPSPPMHGTARVLAGPGLRNARSDPKADGSRLCSKLGAPTPLPTKSGLPPCSPQGDLGLAVLSDLSLPSLPQLAQPDCFPYLSPTMQDFSHLRRFHLLFPASRRPARTSAGPAPVLFSGLLSPPRQPYYTVPHTPHFLLLFVSPPDGFHLLLICFLTVNAAPTEVPRRQGVCPCWSLLPPQCWAQSRGSINSN